MEAVQDPLTLSLFQPHPLADEGTSKDRLAKDDLAGLENRLPLRSSPFTASLTWIVLFIAPSATMMPPSRAALLPS
jgi:hypothetical protein